MKNIILFIARIIPKGKFAPVTYWRHEENKYLYLCMSEKHIIDDDRSSAEAKFIELFSKAIRISKTEFDLIFKLTDIEVVTVADDNIILTSTLNQ